VKTYSVGLEENFCNLLHNQVRSAKSSAAEKSFESILAAYLVHIITKTACINNRQLSLLVNWSEAKRLIWRKRCNKTTCRQHKLRWSRRNRCWAKHRCAYLESHQSESTKFGDFCSSGNLGSLSTTTKVAPTSFYSNGHTLANLY